MLELAQDYLKENQSEKEHSQVNQEKTKISKKTHIGYYLIDNGINKLYEKLEYTNQKEKTPETKAKIYITTISVLTIIFSIFLSLAPEKFAV